MQVANPLADWFGESRAGTTDRLVPASDLADAQRQLATIERDGWPAYTLGL